MLGKRIIAVASLLFVTPAVADEAPSRRSTPVPGVDGSYFVVPPDLAEAFGDDSSRFWGEIEGRKGEDDLVLLRRARMKAIQRANDLAQQEFEAGTITSEELLRIGRQLIDAQLEAATTDAERLAAWEEYLPHVRRQEMEAVARLEIGSVQGFRPLDASLARAQRMAAEIEVLKLRRKVYGYVPQPVEAKRAGRSVEPPARAAETLPANRPDDSLRPE